MFPQGPFANVFRKAQNLWFKNSYETVESSDLNAIELSAVKF